jgi:hypothetical protein
MDSAERDSSGKVYIKAAPTTIVVLIANTETSYLPVMKMVYATEEDEMIGILLALWIFATMVFLPVMIMVYATEVEMIGILPLATIVLLCMAAWMLWHDITHGELLRIRPWF